MKKVCAIIICTAALLLLVSGCGAETKATGSELSGEEILTNFEAKLIPIADQFQMSRSPMVELEEEGGTYLSATITDELLGRIYRIGIHCTEDGYATAVFLHADMDTHTEINFALLSCYLYKSMGLPDIDADAFYDHFDMLTEKPSGSMSAEGWDITVLATDRFLTFGATYVSE